MTVTRLKRECPYAEFLRWQKKYNEEPWGENQCTWQLAVIGALLFNIQLDKKSKRHRIKPNDLMFKRKKRVLLDASHQRLAFEGLKKK